MKFIQITIWCIVGAFITAIVYVVSLTLSLPKSDGAYGQLPFQDPFVFPVMGFGALVSGIVMTPFVYFALRNRNIKKCAYFICPIVLISVILSTSINVQFGLIGAFASLVLSLILCIMIGIGKNELKPTEQRH